MFKENGRLEPADSKETAHLKGKTFKCSECDYEEVQNNVEFSGTPGCPKCYKGKLIEKIDV